MIGLGGIYKSPSPIHKKPWRSSLFSFSISSRPYVFSGHDDERGEK